MRNRRSDKMNFIHSRRKVLGTIFRKYVFDLCGDAPREFTGSDGRKYVPVVMPFGARDRS